MRGSTIFLSRANKKLVLTAGMAVMALMLSACAGGATSSGAGAPITVGTMDKVTALDPAGSYDAGSFVIQNQVFPLLMNNPYGSSDAKPDIAASASFTSPSDFTVVMKPGLKFSNGHDLTSSDAKFSFDRQLKIADPEGPSSVLQNLASVDAPDAATVVFHLKVPNDQTFAQVLASQAGLIVDEQSLSATKVATDDAVVKTQGFAGQYTITSYDFNNLIAFEANPNYGGMLPKAKTKNIITKFYADATNLRLDVQEGNIDVEFRNLSATDTQDLRKDPKVNVTDGAGGELRDIVFNFDTQPFGVKTADADPAKALAVRQAMAHLINREELSTQVYKGTYAPLFSYVPANLPGGNESMKVAYGDGAGLPDAAKAKAVLTAAGITTKPVLNLQYNIGHYGPSSSDEYALIKDQLESSGLFTVKLQSTEWVQYSKDRTSDAYPMYQLGWFPDFTDADNYLSPLYLANSYHQNHFSDPAAEALIKEQATTVDPAARLVLIGAAQDRLAALVPSIPLLVGKSSAVAGSTVTGTADSLDAAYRFRYAPLEKK